MADVTIELLRTHFRQCGCRRWARRSSGWARRCRDQSDLRPVSAGLTEIEMETRAANAVATRIKNAEFPVLKDFDTYDFSVCRSFPSPRSWSCRDANGLNTSTIVVLSGATERARRTSPWPWARRRACGSRVLFFTAAEWSASGGGAKAVHPGPILGELERAQP